MTVREAVGLPVDDAGPLQVWEYVVSHAQLLLRSPMSAKRPFNIDVIISGVQYMRLRPLYARTQIRAAAHGERLDLPEEEALSNSAHRVVVGGDPARGLVIASELHIEKNDRDLFDSPLDFSALRRGM